MQVPTLRRDRWLRVLDESLQLSLLIKRIDQLQCRHVMLCFYDAPADTGKRSRARR
jgi:hypothetical protein